MKKNSGRKLEPLHDSTAPLENQLTTAKALRCRKIVTSLRPVLSLVHKKLCVMDECCTHTQISADVADKAGIRESPLKLYRSLGSLT